MQKYSRNQAKQNQRNLLIENEVILIEESYDQYDDSWEGVPFDGCSCEKCLFVRTLELKIRLYEKHKNKRAMQTLGDILHIWFSVFLEKSKQGAPNNSKQYPLVSIFMEFYLRMYYSDWWVQKDEIENSFKKIKIKQARHFSCEKMVG